VTDLSGRVEQAARLRRIALSSGEHALIYGERGVGKTSIANAFHGLLNTPTSRVQAIVVNCGNSRFSEIWRKVFRRIDRAGGGKVSQDYPGDITTDDVEIELSAFGINDIPIIVLDEFDQIADSATREAMTETIKSMSDHVANATIVIVGIASDVSEIIANHLSISRALKQVPMPRLSLPELENIISARYREVGLTWSDEALFFMGFLSRGLPYYAHLMGRHAGLIACRKKHSLVGVTEVLEGLKDALVEVDQSITEAYLKAIISQRGEDTLYRPVLLACAFADSDVLGGFQQSAVTKPLSRIIKRDPPYTPTTFAFHMNEFCEEKRGAVLEKTGIDRNFRYRFSDALMQPFVILQAMSDGALAPQELLDIIPRRQLDLGV
jgi:Cdc6-like AAA superfamily ATPase